MKEYKITLENGDYFVTRMNASLKEAREYFLGKVLNVGTVGDDLQKIIKVEEL